MDSSGNGLLEADNMILDASCTQEPAQPAKRQKRRRGSGDFDSVDREALAADWRRELDALFEYYKEFSGHRLNPEELGCSSSSSIIACLLEESSQSYSKLADAIYERIKSREGVTLAYVRSTVLLVGQRMMYGTLSANADVLEDVSESCLWCWETRDPKLLPGSLRGSLNIRRTARKKIQERILALSGNLSALASSKNLGNQKSEPTNVRKVLNLEGIRSLIEKLKQKNDNEITKKESKYNEKRLERSMRNAEKQQKKLDRQLHKEQLQKERELKHMKEEAKKEAKRLERENAEQNKLLKKHQEEVEREQKRREKEEAELKKKVAIQKQANIMQRFLKGKKSNNTVESSDNELSTKDPVADSSGKRDQFTSAATSVMDCTISQANSLALEELCALHVAGWRKLSRHNRLCRWGVRSHPKSEVIKELKLQKSHEATHRESLLAPIKESSSHMDNPGSQSFHKLLGELEVPYTDDALSNCVDDIASTRVRFVKKLWQFDKSHRPAYYGTWSKKSHVVGPRHPFRKDPNLDYDVDSDEEWEEEDPGESLSDCEEDDKEIMEEDDISVHDEVESEDGFVVPDGYLSNDEGVQIESPSGRLDEISSFPMMPGHEVEKLNAFLQQQKVLHNLTEQALRKNRPLVISILNQEKSSLLRAEDLSGLVKLEQLCLQALSMWECPGGPTIDVPLDVPMSTEDQEICRSSNKRPSTLISSNQAISDSDLPEFVKLIRSCPHGLSRLVDLLHQSFPTASKKQLKKKVREMAEFVDNRWQVKKDTLDRLGLSVSPDNGGNPRGVSLYFSKRYLPPEDSSNTSESSSCVSKSEVARDKIDSQVPGSSMPPVP